MSLALDDLVHPALVHVKEGGDAVLVFTSPITPPNLNGIREGQSVAWFSRFRHREAPYCGAGDWTLDCGFPLWHDLRVITATASQRRV